MARVQWRMQARGFRKNNNGSDDLRKKPEKKELSTKETEALWETYKSGRSMRTCMVLMRA
jgi:hypothetical protein